MKFPWRRADEGTAASGGPAASAGQPQSCSALGKVLEKILRRDKAEILDLGPFCGDSAVYLADRGARVSVSSFEPPQPASLPLSTDFELAEESELLPEPIRLEEPDAKFDLVLVWEILDFVPPDRLREFGAELRRVLTDGGWSLALSLPGVPERGSDALRPPRYRIIADDRVVRERGRGPSWRRYGHPTREIERALAPLSIQSIHLQRNQLREFLILRRG